MLTAQQAGDRHPRPEREEQGMISTGAMVVMGLLAALTAAVPVGIMVFLKKRGGRWLEFFVGAGTFIFFALALEQILHALVLRSPLGPAVQGSVWLTALYGGLAAGVFEETGRFAAFKLVLRERRAPVSALSYGIGHGGCEAFLLLGVTYLSNIVLCLTVKSGGQVAPELAAAVDSLAAIPAATFLWAGFERVCAMTLHAALSVLVFAAVRRPGKRWLFPGAILLHALADFSTVAAFRLAGVMASEAAAAAFALLAALLAVRVYKNLRQIPENT